MYNFVDLNEAADNAPQSIKMIFKGINFDDELDGNFRTLTTTGRGLANYMSQSENIIGVDGALSKYSTLTTRQISVKVLVSAEDSVAFRDFMSLLNSMLESRQDAELRFTDDLNYFYNARYMSSQVPEETSNEQIVTLIFECNDPRKYSDVKSITISGNGAAINLDTHYAVVAEQIRINFSSQADARDFSLINTTTGKRIVYKSDYGTQATIIRQRDMYLGSTAGANRIRGLNLTFSDFNGFRVNKGDQLVVEPTPQNVVIDYRGVRL